MIYVIFSRYKILEIIKSRSIDKVLLLLTKYYKKAIGICACKEIK